MIANQQIKQILKWAQRTLFAGALTAFAYCAFVMTDAWLFQKRATAELARQVPVAVKVIPVGYANDAPIGKIAIPRLGLSAVIVEGTTAINLRHAVGHIGNTGFPGQPKANIGLAAHRDTFFRPLKDIREQDTITVTTIAGEYRYRVISLWIVTPTDVGVLESGANEMLTLVTCYPFQFVGSAPDRFIVRAERII